MNTPHASAASPNAAFATVPAPVGLPAAAGAIRGALQGAWEAWCRHAQARAEDDALAQLSDATLRDVGLSHRAAGRSPQADPFVIRSAFW